MPAIRISRGADLAALFHGHTRAPKRPALEDSQLWRCLTCRCVRQWGYGEREGTVQPFLLCEGDCKVHTPHVYVGVR